ncbi:PaaI family thioesterase [Phanerochaete sordida]|uniref:PaaI family thioesterase n=1 Tax=Phanerochaete sordida TaxID=48140 RepID=A0A9P3LJ83_9APHY|nr:PaaI family thioesterase [Phanerochaete sordida]
MDTLERSMRSARGNVPQELKDIGADWWVGAKPGQVFARAICERLEVTEARVLEDGGVPGRREGRLVFEIDVTRDMCDAHDTVQSGCMATLIDFCSSLPRNLVKNSMAPKGVHVSLALNTTYHAPAVLGHRLSIIASTVALGARVMTSRAEIYDMTSGIIVASGVHVKVPPSKPRL